MDVDVPDELWVPLPPELSKDDVYPLGTLRSAGQPLTRRRPEVAAVATAPVGGVISDVSRVRVLGGMHALAVHFRVNDHHYPGKSAGDATSDAKSNGQDLTQAELLDRVRACGVWGHRGSCPNLLGQLSASSVRRVVCSLLDPDGWVTAGVPADIERMLRGVEATAGAFKSPGVVVVDRMLPAWEIAWWQSKCSHYKLRLMTLSGKYPRSHADLLTRQIVGRRPRSGQLPTSAGMLLLDGDAASAIGAAVDDAAHLAATVIRVRDHTQKEGLAARCIVGTRLGALLDALKLDLPNVRLFAGALLRQVVALPDDVIAGGETLLQVVDRAARKVDVQACICCAMCVDVCPVNVDPTTLLEAAQHPDGVTLQSAKDDVDRQLRACIDCGLCSPACPSHLPLAESILELRERSHEQEQHVDGDAGVSAEALLDNGRKA